MASLSLLGLVGGMGRWVRGGSLGSGEGPSAGGSSSFTVVGFSLDGFFGGGGLLNLIF